MPHNWSNFAAKHIPVLMLKKAFFEGDNEWWKRRLFKISK
jgi:hypothetical protein